MIEIIAILVAAGDGEYLGAQDVGDAMSDEKWIARIGDQGCELRCDAERLFDGSKQHDPAIGGPPATIEGRFDFFALH